MRAFDEKKFQRYVHNLNNRKDITYTLNGLLKMVIPSEESSKQNIVILVEHLLLEQKYWESAMRAIRKIELEARLDAPHENVEQFVAKCAPMLPETSEFKRSWKEARIQQMRDWDLERMRRRYRKAKRRRRQNVVEKKSSTEAEEEEEEDVRRSEAIDRPRGKRGGRRATARKKAK